MKLLMSPLSPYARKVRVLLRETSQLDAVQEVSVSTSPLASDPVVVVANPTGRVPALIRDDGPAIHDSRVITRFLDARAGGALYPEDSLWEVLTLEATAEGILDSALILTYEGRFRSPEQQSPEWLDAHWAKIARAVSALEDQWLALLDGPLTMGHIATGCALAYLDFRHDARGWRKGHDRLAAWADAFAARPGMAETRPG
ncbi:MAG: glutathione S-transferase [Rubellimicrobium sp.]|nr:glutathione S-transferase [Rubellimicrobium sp.]